MSVTKQATEITLHYVMPSAKNMLELLAVVITVYLVVVVYWDRPHEEHGPKNTKGTIPGL